MSILQHVGVGHEDGGNSGRYPWGSGENPYQNSAGFLARIKRYKHEGMNEKEICEALSTPYVKVSSGKYRSMLAIAKDQERQNEYVKAKHLREKDWSYSAIAKELGYKNDSSVRHLLDYNKRHKQSIAAATADHLKKEVDKKELLNVGIGTELQLGVSRTKMDEALFRLQTQGYNVYNTAVRQATNPQQQTKMLILTTPEKKYKDAYDSSKIRFLDDDKTSHDNGETFTDVIKYPKSLDSKRLQIKYAEDGGKLKDGIIEIRRGVPDLSLYDENTHKGGKYAQCRILVDGTHYLKGIAMYADDLPKGVDVRFNTNKTKDKSMTEVLKEIKKDDPSNPFNSLIDRQNYYEDKDGKIKQGLINVTREEGNWATWSKNCPAQFLSKQPKSLIDQQIKITKDRIKADYDDILKLNNNVIKKQLLLEFANNCDSKAVDLKLAAFPNQKVQVILPLTTLKDNECYAPNFRHGDKLALIRYPHAGRFEIPIVTVNNRNAEGKQNITPNAKDAIGINQTTASILSGADFDGDTVTAIPITPKSQIKNHKPFEGLKNFDPDMEYPERKGMKYMTKKNTQREMGIISNLITDMSLSDSASEEDLTRAVRHSMVVIDAEKHKYDYKLSEKDNNIKELKMKYQKHTDDDGYGGASTLVSKSKQTQYITKRVGSPHIEGTRPGEPKTGRLIYKQEKKEWVDENGKVHENKTKTTAMANTDDARTLISKYNTPQERAYADYANYLKALANEARKTWIDTPNPKMDKEAKKKYAAEVDSLQKKYERAMLNKPKEQRAQLMVDAKVKTLLADNPDLREDKETLRKTKNRFIKEARIVVGADSKGTKVEISPKEWEAIQAGAISATRLSSLLQKTDSAELKKLATPKGNNRELSSAKQSAIKSMLAAGYTNQEIADRFGISVSTVSSYR